MDIYETKDRHKERLLALPNVDSVGVGPKIRGGTPTGEMAVKVFVTRKVPAAELSDAESIPEDLEGFPTDVEVIDKLRARKS